MQENHRARLSFVQTGLPWAVAAVALVLYMVTLNRWVSLDSLPYTAKVTGWDWTLPYQTPLFYLVTYPVRWFPAHLQPLVLNLFSAVCAALTLALLARSVALLPHDRTHEQRLRERNEFSLLSIPAAWLPPILAALVCGLELTFWEHATAATNEALDVLLFAYVIRCLLEFRISQEESWLTRMSFVYGLAVTNNFAMIGFFPCVLVAVFWMKGLSFFEFRFWVRMAGCGLLGLSLYLLLPLAWALSDSASVSFWQALRAHWAGQKAMLFDMPQLRSRTLVLSLTSILPLIIIGIRWPASFGDTSAAGAALSGVMFRVTHTVFLAACIWVAFDQQFSPRALAMGVVPFLTFYYLGALSVGYFSGYLLLVSREARSKSRHRRSPAQALLNQVVAALVWVALLGVAIALPYKNWASIRFTNGPALNQFARTSAQQLPPGAAVVLSDDPYGLLLLSATLSGESTRDNYLMVHTRSLLSPDYHQQLHKRAPARWPNLFTNQPPDEVVDDGSLMFLMRFLSRSNELCYLHPSFGYYFEQFYAQPRGLVYRLAPYPTNSIYTPALPPALLDENAKFWTQLEDTLQRLAHSPGIDSHDAQFLRRNYSRALNNWGVVLQRNDQFKPARSAFELAVQLNTNNVPAESNLLYNQRRLSPTDHAPESGKTIEDKFGIYRGWETMLIDNGPFDHPDFCLRLGQIFGQQGLYRQAAIQFERVCVLEPTNLVARLAQADVFLAANSPGKTLEQLSLLRATANPEPLPTEVELEAIRLEATAQFSLGKRDEAEKTLLTGFSRHPKHPSVLDPLLQIYVQTDRVKDAFAVAQQIIKANPDRVQSYINEAQLFRSQQQSTNALAALDQVLRRFPNQTQAMLYKIFILIEVKDFAQARTEIEQLLYREPENPDALLYKGVVEIESKQFLAAIAPLTRLLKKQPNNANAFRNRALAYLQLGDLKRAEKDYDTMRRLVPRDYVYVAYYGLGEVAYRRKDLATAEKYYSLYLQYAPAPKGNSELVEERKLVSDRLKQIKEAKR